LKRSTDARSGAINASTVFAVTLAIIAGLIFAWVFKTVFLTKPKAPATPVEPTYRVTVMAISVSDNTRIGPLQVKRINVSKAKYDEYKAEQKTKGAMLVGNQPISRVTRDTLRAEEPIYESQLKEMHYPEAVSKKLEPGKVASIVEVPSRNSMVQVEDRVDLLCTVTNTNPQLGPVETRTAVMAKNVRVVARFNTTRDAPTAPRGVTRPYTLEVTPYRYGLIELAKAVGGIFALRIHDRGGDSLAGSATPEEQEDPAGDQPVTTEDLVKVFGFEPQQAPKYFEVESFNGVTQVPGRHVFQQPGGGQAVKPSGGLTPGGVRPKAPGGVRPGNLPKGVTPGRVS
jgi:Flp pilus assembly protein CpaB